MNKELLRKLPKIDELLSMNEVKAFMEQMPREKLVDVLRNAIEAFRKDILEGKYDDSEKAGTFGAEAIISKIRESLTAARRKSLRPVINATGVVLHTNLGRSNLSEAAIEAVNSVACSYSTLEYDPSKGCRGSRHDHLEGIIKKITGAEAAMIVNNNAAATMLTMAAIGRGKEMIVSRGELVEIGGSFRIPDIMAESGAFLVEVGTTNKTHFSDYERKINENTAALLKVHTSNYKIIGFSEDVSVRELKGLAKKYDIPVIYDIGSGLMADLSDIGILEPSVKSGFDEGADVVLFSGDKLLGGPQAGIIAGKKKYIDMMKSHPLARVVRVDKMTIAAMEATLSEYYDPEDAKKNIPVLRMLTRSFDELKDGAEKLKTVIESKNAGYSCEIIEDEGLVGGGSAPGCTMKNAVVAVSHNDFTAAALDRLLHMGDLPIVARIRNDRLIFDLRTIKECEFNLIADRLAEIPGTK
ncbi:MAG: L-seryl-tRNA(Sec) selenium transferase [Clostridia bacterium]|nr:L-seryl-tRNA(Sec) selenium transferase [Clostridia bacterium]